MDKVLRHRVNAGRVAVQQQVDFFRKQFGQVPSEWKEDETRVTFADFAISERVFTELRNSFPEDDYCSEESNPLDEVSTLHARYAWVLDPIDGTNNYALGIPFCAISLALLKDGVPVYGILYDFSQDWILEGGPGHGLWRNGKRFTPPPHAFERKDGVVGLHFPIPDRFYDAMRPLLTRYRARVMGSGALNLAYTALGLMDGCIDFKVKVWDIAAASALVAAVGGQIHYLQGPAFPLKHFHVRSPLVPYVGGSAAFCDWVAQNIGLDALKATEE
ncbi:MAG: inositol monophosphatase family protein [Verrucomicrobiota bacterium JB022]|nr:inositol monophosphatase family protein [Verrucomicrobiota bacterium JB022]